MLNILRAIKEKEKKEQQAIANRLTILYKEYDKKQDVTAMYLNCHKSTFSRYCNGVHRFPYEYAEKLSKRWGVRIEYILCIDDIKY